MKKLKLQGKRIVSFFLAFLMLFSAVKIIGTTSTMADSSSVTDTRVSDPNTMNDWVKYFGANIPTTQNAGSVWTDKSVFTNADAFSDMGITMDGTDNKSFLVALSAIASSQSVTGLSNVPTDTMLVLDLSSSMYPSLNPSTVQTMLSAVNSTINKLQGINKHNRVGVVVYFGAENLSQSDSKKSIVMLPLDRYSGSTTYLKANVSNSKLVSISVNSGLKNEAGKNVSVLTHTVKSVAGTYAQLGILDAMEQLVNADEKVIPADADFQPNVARVPVLVFMSDGEPTASTEVFYQKGDAHWGNNSVANRSPAESDFVTQLTAAYAKERIDEAYSATTPLFYTLSLGNDISMEVMDPANNTNATIDSYWNSLITTGKTQLSVRVSTGPWGPYKDGVKYTVQRTNITKNGKTVTFPSTIQQRNYVDQSFNAASAGNLADVFEDIVTNINLQSRYYPTLVQGDEDLDGYISFVDKIGQYMEVTDIKGILIHDDLFSGVDMASNFVPNGSGLGSEENPTALGDELVWAVKARLGIDDAATARTLIYLAYKAGQLYYNAETGEYSNYIGWYANAAGQYLGFWNEGETVIPQATGDPATDPAFLIKSYGYLGEVDETHGVDESDMMYATVQVRESISTGEQTVVFSIPAALIPIVEYKVALNEDGGVDSLTVSGATSPMRLVYEVALKDEITEITINDPNVVDPEYVKANKNSDGSVNFYTNQYETDNTTGYGTVNTYSYFRPSHQNNQYYFTENLKIYTDKNGTLYNSASSPDATKTYYVAYRVYSNQNGKATEHYVYQELSSTAIGVAVKDSNNTWHIPAGAVHAKPFGITEAKIENETDTLPYSNSPFVDIYGHEITDAGHRFVVGSTLGNNGRLSIMPETGIKLTKTVNGQATPNDSFAFVISGSSVDTSKTYSALKISADGTQTETTVSFDANNQATVYLLDGETLYITGMTAGSSYTVTENETVKWVVESVNGNTSAKDASVTLSENQFSEIAFVNKERGVGSLTITKYVSHELGDNYHIPEDISFDVSVTLSGIGTANQTFVASHSGNAQVKSITTDANGAFDIQLKANEQLEIDGLPNGTVATVVELNPGAGFAASYYEAEATESDFVLGDGVVIVNGVAAAVVLNTYKPEKITPEINVGGTKYFLDEDGNDAVWTTEEFTFKLQQYVNGAWVDVDTKTATSSSPTFKFDTSSLSFDAVGVYAFQTFEVEPEDEDKLPGVFYENEWHTFSVFVTDDDMDGSLEISKIYSDHSGKTFTQNDDGSWTITTDFTNVQHITAPVTVVIDTKKNLENLSNSPLVNVSGFLFGLYTDESCNIAASANDDQRLTAIDYVPTDAAGEGWIDIIINDVGEYTFYVKEIQGDNDKMTYSQKVVRVDITVTQISGGKLHAETTFTTVTNDLGEPALNDEALNSEDQIEFTNTYIPTSAEFVLEATKTLNGRDMDEGEFTFEIRPFEGTVGEVVTGTNIAGKDGEAVEIRFGSIEYTKVGRYVYEVVETSADGNGVTTDKTKYQIIVTVTDVNGELKATVTVYNLVSNVINFVNDYKSEPAEYKPSGEKILNGRALVNDEFSFVIAETDANGNVLDNGYTETVKNFANGAVEFSTIKYTETGVYYYNIYEMENAVVNGITFDKSVYNIVVTVTDNLKGNLVAETEIFQNGISANSVRFTNTYIPASTGANIHGSKILTGKVLGSGDYTFELHESNSNWELSDSPLEVVENQDNGYFTFQILETYNQTNDSYYFQEAGTYYFLVKETNGGETIDGVYYDNTVFRVKIEITDNLRGQLVPTVYIYDSEDVQIPDIVFMNSYNIISDAEITISGTKTLENLDLEDEMFSFNLFAADEFFAKGELIETVKNYNGEFEFNIAYTAEDVEIGTFYYIIEEENAGKTINGITYSSVVYKVTVTVEDDGVGGIITTLNIEGGSVSFVNTYNADSTYVSIDGTKNLEGIRDLVAGEFTFELYEADANFNAIGNAIQSVVNDADGSFTFEDVTFSEAGSYYFIVTENSDNPLGGVIYDANKFFVTIVVEDDGEGNLFVASNSVTDNSGEEVEAIEFNNVYETTDATVSFEGNKVLNGKELENGEFAFLLYQTGNDYSINADRLIDNTVNNAEGNFAFNEITFNAVGNYYYVIVEDTSVTAEGITYDESKYCIMVTVEDNGNGNLVVSDVEITKNGSAIEDIVFENTYFEEDNDIPQTGDTNNTYTWFALMMFSGACLMFITVKSRTKRII